MIFSNLSSNFTKLFPWILTLQQIKWEHIAYSVFPPWVKVFASVIQFDSYNVSSQILHWYVKWCNWRWSSIIAQFSSHPSWSDQLDVFMLHNEYWIDTINRSLLFLKHMLTHGSEFSCSVWRRLVICHPSVLLHKKTTTCKYSCVLLADCDCSQTFSLFCILLS